MKIDILSDIHINMWHEPHSTLTPRKKRMIFSKALPQDSGEVLVIAGDLGHYNKQSLDLLKWFQDEYGYKIVYVWGNHDYYLVSNSQRSEYKNSIIKAHELRDMINEQEGMYHLDGEAIEINGIRFGGCNGWYDGSLYNKNSELTNILWKDHMNDVNIKLPAGEKRLRFDTFHQQDLPKIEAVHKECDVMITHVCPVADWSIFRAMYGEQDPVRAFYCFDGKRFIKEGTMQYWIFGHTHKPYDKEHFGKQLICNPFGRPSIGKIKPTVSSKQIEVL